MRKWLTRFTPLTVVVVCLLVTWTAQVTDSAYRLALYHAVAAGETADPQARAAHLAEARTGIESGLRLSGVTTFGPVVVIAVVGIAWPRPTPQSPHG